MAYEPYPMNPNPFTYNPMLGYQTYMQNMGSTPQQGVAQQSPAGLKGRAVSGVEEARAAQIDFDGTLHSKALITCGLFAAIAHGNPLKGTSIPAGLPQALTTKILAIYAQGFRMG